MASIRKEMLVGADPQSIWEAIRDVGAVHRRLAPGFVVDCRLEEDGGARVVTFANGLVARELIVDIDDAARRLVWAVVDGRPTHHNASLQVFAEGDGRQVSCAAPNRPCTNTTTAGRPLFGRTYPDAPVASATCSDREQPATATKQSRQIADEFRRVDRRIVVNRIWVRCLNGD